MVFFNTIFALFKYRVNVEGIYCHFIWHIISRKEQAGKKCPIKIL